MASGKITLRIPTERNEKLVVELHCNPDLIIAVLLKVSFQMVCIPRDQRITNFTQNFTCERQLKGQKRSYMPMTSHRSPASRNQYGSNDNYYNKANKCLWSFTCLFMKNASFYHSLFHTLPSQLQVRTQFETFLHLPPKRKKKWKR